VTNPLWPKSETRKPKCEGIPKSEVPKEQPLWQEDSLLGSSLVRLSGFGLPSGFGFRVSDLGVMAGLWTSLPPCPVRRASNN
jgi:hypothetical protein